MLQSDKTIITLHLILNEFGIDTEQGFNQKYDLMCSCIVLTQLVYPLEYEFEVFQSSSGHYIRSSALVGDLEILHSKIENGEFINISKRYNLSKKMIIGISKLIPLLTPPENITIVDWIKSVAMYSVLSSTAEDNEIKKIMISEHRNILPYLDFVHQKIKEIKNG